MIKFFIKKASFDLSFSKFRKKSKEILDGAFLIGICVEYGYNALITAHNLNDRFEWFLMRLSKRSWTK